MEMPSMNYHGNFQPFPEGLIGFIILIAPLAMPGGTANAQQGVVTKLMQHRS